MSVRAFALLAFGVVGVAGGAGCAGNKASPPGPPPPEPFAEWQTRCADRLRAAQEELAEQDPAFAAGEVVLGRSPASVRLDMRVTDAEHSRYFDGPAEFKVFAAEKPSAEPGELGGIAGRPEDRQVSMSLSRWTTTRYATMDVQIVGGPIAFRFQSAFSPALDDCLK